MALLRLERLQMFFLVFFFSSRRRHTRYIGDWSSDVCSSDLFLCERVLGHVRPDALRKGCGREIRKQPLPVLCENQKRAVERLRRGILTRWRKRRIAVAVNGFCNFAVLNEGRAVPGLYDKPVAPFHIPENEQH